NDCEATTIMLACCRPCSGATVGLATGLVLADADTPPRPTPAPRRPIPTARAGRERAFSPTGFPPRRDGRLIYDGNPRYAGSIFQTDNNARMANMPHPGLERLDLHRY